MANKWLTIECIVKEAMLVGPAELALAWPGSKPTGEVDIYLIYWQPLMPDLKKAHPELVWQGSKDTPFVRVSEAEAKSVHDKLFAFARTKFPDVKKKKQKETMIFKIGSSHNLATTTPVAAADVLLQSGDDKDVWTIDLGGKKLLLWRLVLESFVRARVTADGFLLVDSERDEDELDALVKGKATSHGTWKFDKGLAVAHWARFALPECKGLETGKLAAIEAVVAKKPAALVRPLNNADMGHGSVLKIPSGSYRIETGGDKKARWLRAVR